MYEKDGQGNLLEDIWSCNIEMPHNIGKLWMALFRDEMAKKEE